MRRWKYFLILVLAVVLLHILIIKIFFIGIGGEQSASDVKNKNIPAFNDNPEPNIPGKLPKK